MELVRGLYWNSWCLIFFLKVTSLNKSMELTEPRSRDSYTKDLLASWFPDYNAQPGFSKMYATTYVILTNWGKIKYGAGPTRNKSQLRVTILN